MLRLFIAVPVIIESRQAISDSLLKTPGLKSLPLKLCDVDSLHLTLQFLGDTEEAKLPMLRTAMQTITPCVTPIFLRFDQVGCFPNLSEPRVLWLGIADNPELLRIQKELTTALVDAGFKVDRKRFSPHLTLARMRDYAPADAGQKALQLLRISYERNAIPNSPVNEMILFKSELRPGGSVYSSLYCQKL